MAGTAWRAESDELGLRAGMAGQAQGRAAGEGNPEQFLGFAEFHFRACAAGALATTRMSKKPRAYRSFRK